MERRSADFAWAASLTGPARDTAETLGKLTSTIVGGDKVGGSSRGRGCSGAFLRVSVRSLRRRAPRLYTCRVASVKSYDRSSSTTA